MNKDIWYHVLKKYKEEIHMVIKSVSDLPEDLNDQDFALMSELLMGILPDEDLGKVESIIEDNDFVIAR